MFFRAWIAKKVINNYVKANAIDLAASMTGDALDAYLDPSQAYYWITTLLAQQLPLQPAPATPARYKV